MYRKFIGIDDIRSICQSQHSDSFVWRVCWRWENITFLWSLGQFKLQFLWRLTMIASHTTYTPHRTLHHTHTNNTHTHTHTHNSAQVRQLWATNTLLSRICHLFCHIEASTPDKIVHAWKIFKLPMHELSKIADVRETKNWRCIDNKQFATLIAVKPWI